MWLGLLPFIILLFLYVYASDLRLTANPDDKLLPAFATLGDSIHRLALEENQRSGEILLWSDTAASLKRLALGIGISALLGLVVGIATGAMPLVRANLSPLVAVLSMVPPMAMLPILFIVFGLGEVSKVVLIVIGIAPFIMRDMSQRVMELPKEQLIKAQTLGGSTWLIILRVILPQILPRLIDAVRLSLGAAWLFLIAAEAIASTDGLGYRIFLVRRYLSMEIILPYVAWITLLAYVFDLVMRQFSKRCFPWFDGGAKA
jgi:NitT/TauT family transport system permease protein